MITERGILDLPTRNRELVLIALAMVIGTVGFLSVDTARAQSFSSSPLIAAMLFTLGYLAAHAVLRVLLPDADPYVLPITAVLAAIGLIEIHRISPQLARDQSVWMALGVALFIGVVLAFRDIRRLESLKYTSGALAVLLLLATIAVGTSVNGARLWLRVGGLQIQPGEFAKILLVVFLAGYLRERREVLAAPTRRILGVGVPALRHALPLLLLCGISLVLLVAMNDLGSSLLFYVLALALIYIATGRLLYVGAGLGLFALGAAVAVQFTSHVQSRIGAWLDPWSVERTSGYQIAQSIYTIADGGVIGAGFGRGLILDPSGRTIIPYAQTDFIYSVIANELGLLGAAAVVLLYLLLAWRGFRIATTADDGFSKLLAAGLATAVAFQVLVIVGGVVRLLPLTGLTLPFVSYGGSSVTANFAIAALLLCVSQRANRGARSVNRRIAQLFAVLAVALVALIVMTSYWQIWARGSLEARQANTRQVYRELTIDRGSILSADGVTLATSVPAQLDGRTIYRRSYPEAGLTAQLIGYSNLLAGRAGLERSLDPELSGSTSDLSGLRNAFDRMRGDTVRGDDVVLGLSIAAQQEAMDQLRAIDARGAVVVIDPSTGSLLTMASTPTYDPNAGLAEALSDPNAPLLNRATQGLYPPGSTFKVVTAASALDSGTVTIDTEFPGPACLAIAGQELCNFRRRAYGPHDFGFALVHSINTTFAKVGMDLGAEQLESTMRDFGFFRRIPFDYPPEQTLPSGIFNRRGNLVDPSTPVDAARLAIGQERLLATPLQMALVAAAVANGGQVVQPQPVQEVKAPDGSVVRRPQPVFLGRAMTTETAATLRLLMREVVDDGTGTAANIAGLDIAGKTGTAETGVEGRNDAWFIGFAPASAPRYAFAVLVEDTAGTGGDVAAPIAAAVVQALTGPAS